MCVPSPLNNRCTSNRLDTNVSTTTQSDRYSLAFNRIADVGVGTECPIGAERPRWSITYGGDESMEHPWYNRLVPAVFALCKEGGYVTVTVQDAFGNEASMDCVAEDLRINGTDWATGDDSVWIDVKPYYSETDSVGRHSMKLFLHQIINIHIP